MKIYELIKNANEKVSVKQSEILRVKKYYLSMYRAYMVMMYDRGYISDPTGFNTKEIFNNIVDMDIHYLTGVTGKIELSEDNIGFALSKYKGSGENKDISIFLELLLGAVKYRNISMNIDKFYVDSGISGSSKRKMSLGLVQKVAKIFCKNGYSIDEGILKCFYGIDKNFKFVSIDEWVYSIALEELGLSDIDTDKGLFIKGISREEEIKYCELILNGLVNIDGEYADRLVSWLKRNKWSDEGRFTSQKQGMYNWVLFYNTNKTIEEQSRLLNELVDSGKKIVSMNSNGFYIVDDEKDTIEIPIGVFSIVSNFEEDLILPDINKLDGYTGEVYPLATLEEYDVSYVGCPIELFIKENKRALFVDKEQTDMKDTVSWFSDMRASLAFDEDYDCSGVVEDGIERKLQEALIESERGKVITKFKISDYLEITDATKKFVINSMK